MDLFPLHLFPEGSLSESVITTVWVGVWVVAFFNLRLGWTFSGLVVPGYLVPLFIARPWCGFTICLEGIVTYLIVYFLSERLSGWSVGGWRIWSSVFGRDRYFALLLTSLLVRSGFDGWLLPWVGAYVNERLHVQFDYQNNLYSFGLIIVPLVANQFWKTGLKGIWPQSVILAVSYCLIRFGLMVLTNFNVGNLAYMYETIASDLYATPKAYMISITAAYLASRMNLLYSWEYHGIHIPALLALQWYDPVKIVSTFVEAVVIFVLAGWVLKAPWFRKRSFEGAQKMLLFCTVGFVWKIALGYFLLWYLPGVKVTDWFAIGYLVSTLMAVKAHDKGIALKLFRATLQISMVGVLIGTLIGFGLTFVPRNWYGLASPEPAGEEAEAPRGTLADIVRRERLTFYPTGTPGVQPSSRAGPSGEEVEAFAAGLHELLAPAADRDLGRLRSARDYLRRAHYRVDLVQDRYLCLHELTPARGWGVYVLDLQRPQGLAVAVPAALDEWGVVESGALLFQHFGGRSLAVAGRETSAGMLAGRRSLYQAFCRAVGKRNVLQVRGHTTASRRALVGRQQGEVPTETSSLWVKAALPGGLNLAALRELLGSYQINWQPSPLPNPQRDETWSEFAELFLSRVDRRTLLAHTAAGPRKTQPAAQLAHEEGNLKQRLLEGKNDIAVAGSDLYQPIGQEELLFFDSEVLTPLLETLRTHAAPDAEEELRAIAAAAGLFGYRLTRYRDRPTGADYLILAEPPSPPRRRCWGNYVFRMGPANPYVAQVPRPLFEMNSFEYGIALFERLEASALLIAGTDGYANRNGTSDLLDVRNKVSLFNLVAQVLLRESGEKPLLLLQTRAFGVRPEGPQPTADVLLALGSGSTTRSSLTPLGSGLLDALEADRMSVKFVDGSPEVAGYDATGLLQAGYLDQARNKEFGAVWLSPLARQSYRQQADNKVQEAQFRGLGVPTVEKDLYEHLAGLQTGEGAATVPQEVRRLAERYIASQDAIALYTLLERGKGLRFERVLDPGSQQAFLLIYSPGCRLPLVANLVPRQAAAPSVLAGDAVTPRRVGQFLDARATWLELGRAP
jgi:hypothetical protein